MKIEDAIRSAGLLMYKKSNDSYDVLLCRPFSYNKNSNWGIPKGRIDKKDKNELYAAKREFFEETGLRVPDNTPMLYLGNFLYPSGKKKVWCWAFKHDPGDFKWQSNIIEIKDKKGKKILIPEIAEWKWFSIDDALRNIMYQQKDIIVTFYDYLKNTY